MKHIFRITSFATVLLSMVSCYEDYMKDYDYSAVYFASQKPLRTVIADRDMTIKVGAAIGGKREININDYADFEIAPELLEGTSLTLLPEECYKLSDPSRMRVSKSTLSVADVEISFTDAFYNLPKATETHYAIPFRLVDSSLDSILITKNTSIVAIKYISTWHGTYYVSGTLNTLDAAGDAIESVQWGSSDMSKNITRDLMTISKSTICRKGLANFPLDNAAEKVQLQMNPDKTVTVTSADGGVEITGGCGTFDDSGDRLQITLSYKFERKGIKYQVEEVLTRRQDPLKDLRYEEW